MLDAQLHDSFTEEHFDFREFVGPSSSNNMDLSSYTSILATEMRIVKPASIIMLLINVIVQSTLQLRVRAFITPTSRT